MRAEESVNCVFIAEYSAVSLSTDNRTAGAIYPETEAKNETRSAVYVRLHTGADRRCGIAYGVRRFNQLAHIYVIQSEP